MNQDAAKALTTMRSKCPLVHCITNYVSMDIAANILLAIGASPIMAHAPEEVEDMVKICNCTYINIGTLSKPWVDSMILAAKTADSLHKNWVLDPVAAGVTSLRNNALTELLKYNPAVIRGNASEILALSGAESNGKGVDSADTAASAIEPAKILAKKQHCIVGVTGESDYVTDGEKVIKIDNGVELCTKITAAGCSLSAVVGAFVGCGIEPLLATAYALTIYGLAAEMAAKDSKGPASLRVNFIDALYNITEEDVIKGAKIQYI